MKYDDLIKQVNAVSNIKIGRSYLGLSMVKHPQPVSITEREFNFITEFIVKHDLKKGFEVATAFGISALAGGLGFKETGGRLITMDSYVEEVYNDCDGYRHNPVRQHFDTNPINGDPDGYILCNNILTEFELNQMVITCIGASPNDIYITLRETIGNRLACLDYVFIDAEHNDLALLTDLSAIAPFLGIRHAIFIHDKHCFGPQLDKLTKRIFNDTFKVVFPDKALQDHYNLAVITKNI